MLLLLPFLLLQGSMAVNNTHFKGSWRPEEDAALRECVAGSLALGTLYRSPFGCAVLCRPSLLLFAAGVVQHPMPLPCMAEEQHHHHLP